MVCEWRVRWELMWGGIKKRGLLWDVGQWREERMEVSD